MTNGTYTNTLKQPGFHAFFWTQFLGAFNDNFYKMVVSLVALNLIAGDADHFYVDIGEGMNTFQLCQSRRPTLPSKIPTRP